MTFTMYENEFLFAFMKDQKQFQWFRLQVSGHLKCLLIITVVLETVYMATQSHSLVD